jgi:hypothetical protein
VIGPDVVAVFVWMIVAEPTVKEFKGAAPPITPVKVVVPDPPTTVNAWAPFKVELKVMFAPLEVMALVPVKLRALPKTSGLDPETVILFPTWMRLALVNIRLAGGAVPPTIPPNETLPIVPARKAIVVVPFKELVKLIFAPAATPPAFVVSKVGEPEAITGPVNVAALKLWF